MWVTHFISIISKSAHKLNKINEDFVNEMTEMETEC